MKLIIKLFGVLMLLAGISLLIKPEFIFLWMENNMESTSLYISAIGVRLVLGILFIVAARESKFAGIIKFLGFVFIVAALIFIFMGRARFQDFIASVISNAKPFSVVAGLFAFAFGSFLIYAFSGNKAIK